MKTGEGGFIHRMMPPVDWNYGPIPDECYDKNLSTREIEKKLLEVYLQPERARALADSDDELELMHTKWAIEIVAEMDADFIWCFNLAKKD